MGFSDASHNDDSDTSHSTLSRYFTYNDTVISGWSRLGNSVDSCVNHSEINAFLEAAREAQFLGDLESEMLRSKMLPPTIPVYTTMRPIVPVPILVDNTGVAAVLENPINHHANKFIRKRIHGAKEAILHGLVAIHRVPTDLNLADIGTKQCSRARNQILTDRIVRVPRYFA